MKKIISILAIIAMAMTLTFALDTEANSFREVKVVNSSSLVVKSAPTTEAATIATLKRGDFVTVFSVSNGWATIQAKTTKGYVNAASLGASNATIKIASSKGGLVVKEDPSRSAKTLAVLKYNMIVEDFGTAGEGWSFVQYGNVTGYVASNFIGVPKTTSKIAKESIPLRNIASPSGAVKTTLPAGTRVTVHSTIAGWSYVSSGTHRGYTQDAKLQVATTNKIAYAKDYLPACPKTYKKKHEITEAGKTDTEYVTYNCNFEGAARTFTAQDDSYDIYIHSYTLKETALRVGYYEGHSSYQFPLTIGKSWSYDAYVESYETMYVMSLNEIVTTPARTFFNVIKIRVTTDYGVAYHYLAPGAGIIKIEGENRFDGKVYKTKSELVEMY